MKKLLTVLGVLFFIASCSSPEPIYYTLSQGEKFNVSGLEVTFNEREFIEEIDMRNNTYLSHTPDSGNDILLLNFTFRNLFESPEEDTSPLNGHRVIDGLSFSVIDEFGESYGILGLDPRTLPGDIMIYNNNVPLGETKTGYIAFELPKNSSEFRVLYEGNFREILEYNIQR